MARDSPSLILRLTVVRMLFVCHISPSNTASAHPASNGTLNDELQAWNRTSAEHVLPTVKKYNNHYRPSRSSTAESTRIQKSTKPKGSVKRTWTPESVRIRRSAWRSPTPPKRPRSKSRTMETTERGQGPRDKMDVVFTFAQIRTTSSVNETVLTSTNTKTPISTDITEPASTHIGASIDTNIAIPKSTHIETSINTNIAVPKSIHVETSINANIKMPTSTRTQPSINVNRTVQMAAHSQTTSNVNRPDLTSTYSRSASSANVTDPEDEIHLRLGLQDFLGCWMKSEYKGKRSSDPPRFYRELYARKGSIVVDFNLSNDQQQKVMSMPRFNTSAGCLSYMLDFFCCSLRVKCPQNSYVAVKLHELVDSSVFLDDPEGGSMMETSAFQATEDNVVNYRVFESSTNVINIVHLIRVPVKFLRVRLSFQFQALPKPGFQVRRTEFNRGTVETPMYDRRTVMVSPLRDPWAVVRVPPDHVVMTSHSSLSNSRRWLEIISRDHGHETVYKFLLGRTSPPSIATYSACLLYIHMHNDMNLHKIGGFRLHFSFHNNSAVPVKLSDRTWNCSVPYRNDFLYHMACNMRSDCHDAEDEKDCSYTSDLCGPGYLTLGGGCFFYVWSGEMGISSTEASEICSRQGGRLAILYTKDKWDDAVRVLPYSNIPVTVFMGITTNPAVFPLWYSEVYRWQDQTTAFFFRVTRRVKHSSRCYSTRRTDCGYLAITRDEQYRKTGNLMFFGEDCDKKLQMDVLCEKVLHPTEVTPSYLIPVNGTGTWSRDSGYVECPLGHHTHLFLACDVRSSCWSLDYSSPCRLSLTPLPPSFACLDQIISVPYTLVCDQRNDCVDGSDEDFCIIPPCKAGLFSCDNKQCIPTSKICNGWSDCVNRNDENECGGYIFTTTAHPPPAIVNMTDSGRLVVLPVNTTKEDWILPDTHFQCLTAGYLLPRVLRCNGIFDCPGREDEVGCDSCPGLFRCRASSVCLHRSDLCDGHGHCPQHDDELMCDLKCPSVCVCRGLAFFCRHNFMVSAYPQLRFLDASGTFMNPAHLIGNHMLIYLSLAICGLVNLGELRFPNLHSLNVQDNQLTTLSKAHLGVPRLTELSVAGNPLALTFGGVEELGTFHDMLKLDLSRIVIRVLNVTVISAVFPNLHDLNLSDSDVQRVLGVGFRDLQDLRVLDLRGCPMKWFPRDVFQGLHDLQLVHGHSFKMCCPALLPKYFNVRNCFAPSDEISSCGNLLRGHAYSASVFVFSLLALVGNAVSFVFRICVSDRARKLGYGVFVTHLSVSDFLMGVYLAFIGAADQLYRGAYVWNDESWKHSIACKLAGFLSLLSSEVSAFIVCLITMDRFLVLRFPFSRFHFSPRSAHAALIAVWMVGLVLASVPLLPATSHWEFYSQTGICIPLPITRSYFSGHHYSFGILIICNCVVFVFISFGQLSIYWSVRVNSMSVSESSKKTKDMSVARCLVTVAMTDFLCWFPIGILGVLAKCGVPVSGELIVAIAIFILPLNSAVNPYLYSFNIIIERRARIREDKLKALLVAQFKARG